MATRLISHYQVVRRLGSGGMGEVLLARDTNLERLVALKVMSAELAKDENQRKRFRTEAKAASGLNHPHICVIHEVGETEDRRPFLAMEYIEGQTLDVVMQQRRLKIREVVNLGVEVAEALEAAHTRGLVHRDIKPGNLMLGRGGEVKVLDFGLAKRFAADELSGAITTVAHTRTGMLIGTPQYMSPEQALGRELSPASDLFSLGVVLYELLAGQRPFLGKTVGETINNIINHPPAPLGLENPIFSPALDQILLKCLEKDPEKRYASARALGADLRKLKEESEAAWAATTQERATGPRTPVAGKRAPTALWKLPAKTAGSRKAALGWTLGFAAVALLVLGGSALFRRGLFKPASPGTAAPATIPRQSVAVLPFVNLSADKADEYLSDGLTEEVLNALAKVKGLRVPARTSCFVFKEKTDDIRKIGEQLRVATVLEGSVRKAGDQLRITAQLINVADGFHLWSETYDRDMANIFTIQSDIASRVAEALKGQLLGEERQQLATGGTKNAEAYRHYLHGRYLWNRRTPEDLKQAIEYFELAISHDAAYALAYAGLADCYAVLPFYTGLPRPEILPKARAAALKALELDGNLAEPHAALADIRAYLDWDWSGAEAEFRRAIALNPNYATAHLWYANLLDSLCRREEALEEIKKAQALDPLSRIINASLGFGFFVNDQGDLATEVLERQVALDPDFVVAHQFLGTIYLAQGKLAKALAALETMHKLDASGTYRLEELAHVYWVAGRTNEARRILAEIMDFQRQGHDMRVAVAKVQHVLGDEGAALDSLEKALEERAFGLEALHCDPYWSQLRPHPRFQAILRRMNLVQ